MIRTIMVVDDDPRVLERMRNLLENENLNVTTARTNKEAIEILEREKSIGAILLRARMPDGRDVFIPFIRRDDKTLPLDMEMPRNCSRSELVRFVSELTSL
ncbi:MAG TPA: response regulator [Thermoplasmatales archaeon]|nr:response regulator [Thermoplasmatales archaeon]HEX17661.1 response regulator [Thermoplasmatales archaeon]